MKHTLALVLMVFGIVGCSTDNNKIRLVCDCIYEINDGNKSSCNTSEFTPVKTNISLVINENDKSLIFDGDEHKNYYNSVDLLCTELVDGVILTDTENCTAGFWHDSGKIARFDNSFIRYYEISTVVGGLTIEFDRTNLVLKKQYRPKFYVFPDGEFNRNAVREPEYIRPELSPYEYYQCQIASGA